MTKAIDKFDGICHQADSISRASPTEEKLFRADWDIPVLGTFNIQLIEAHCSWESLSIPLNNVSVTTELTLILVTWLRHIFTTTLTNKIVSTPARVVMND